MKRLLTSCFGLGLLPVAPGTWGSLPPVLVFVLLCYFSTSAVLTSIVMAALALAGSIICVKCAPAVIALSGKTDPREVVVDEVAGQAVTYLPVRFFLAGVLSSSQILGITLLGFFLFRFFDIVKPWPIRKLEALPKGWGILADDLLAGVYSAIVLAVYVRSCGAGCTG